MPGQDVALPALRRTTGRVGAVLGLSQIVDHLFDVPPLPGVPDQRRRLVWARRPAPAADGPRAARLLAGAPRPRGGADTTPRSSGAAKPAARRRWADHRGGASRLHPGRARHPRKPFGPAGATRRDRGRTCRDASRASGGGRSHRGLGRPDEPVRRAGGLIRPQVTAAAGRWSARAGRPSTGRSRCRAGAWCPAVGPARSPRRCRHSVPRCCRR